MDRAEKMTSMILLVGACSGIAAILYFRTSIGIWIFLSFAAIGLAGYLGSVLYMIASMKKPGANRMQERINMHLQVAAHNLLARSGNVETTIDTRDPSEEEAFLL